jgi:2-furoyl-CoA dehydrogenase FAD binding subunit
VVEADAFQQGVLETARAPDELVTAVRWPLAEPGAGYAFEELGMRHGDFAIVAVAAIARAGSVTVGVGGVADRPEVRTWPALEGGALDDALNDFSWALGGHDDQHATARYRRELVRRLGRRAVEKAMACRA